MVTTFVELTKKARQNGILAIEGDVRGVKDDFMRRGLQLVEQRPVPTPEIDHSAFTHRQGGDGRGDDWAVGLLHRCNRLEAVIGRIPGRTGSVDGDGVFDSSLEPAGAGES